MWQQNIHSNILGFWCDTKTYPPGIFWLVNTRQHFVCQRLTEHTRSSLSTSVISPSESSSFSWNVTLKMNDNIILIDKHIMSRHHWKYYSDREWCHTTTVIKSDVTPHTNPSSEVTHHSNCHTKIQTGTWLSRHFQNEAYHVRAIRLRLVIMFLLTEYRLAPTFVSIRNVTPTFKQEHDSHATFRMKRTMSEPSNSGSSSFSCWQNTVEPYMHRDARRDVTPICYNCHSQCNVTRHTTYLITMSPLSWEVPSSAPSSFSSSLCPACPCICVISNHSCHITYPYVSDVTLLAHWQFAVHEPFMSHYLHLPTDVTLLAHCHTTVI
jgi:hypothetical protein